MKRVLYNTCIVDPWAKVALRMQEKHGWEPVYWIGYPKRGGGVLNDNSYMEVPRMFPNIVYQDYFNAWRGVFSKEIEDKSTESYLDIDFLREMSCYELQAMKMMDRLDYDRHSFNFMERERCFLNLVKSWNACIDLYGIDVVVSAVVPHRVYDYVLYLVCKQRNIKYICIENTMCRERIYGVDDIFTIGNIFEIDYQNFKKQGGLTKNDLSEEICLAYEKVISDYSVAIPSYMLAHPVSHKRSSSMLLLGKRLLKSVKIFGKDGVLRKGYRQTVYKNKKYSLEESRFSLLEFGLLRRKTFVHNKEMQRYYKSRSENVDLTLPYVFLPLHYQPEATTSPSGDIFVNQRLCVEILLKYLPESYYVYVKEHPNQFMNHMMGHTSRIKEFYDDLAKHPRVKMVSLGIDSYSLIRNAKGVATVTGTVGWEAMAQQKPVINFGIFWYEGYSGVLRVTDETSAMQITSFIEDYHYDEQDLFAYLKAFDKNTVRAYHYSGRKAKVNISESECLDNLERLLLKFEDTK